MRRPGRLRDKKVQVDSSGRAPSDHPRRARADVKALLNTDPELVLAQCRSPRYWPVWLFDGWLRFSAALPRNVSLSLHKILGRISGALSRRRSGIVRRNLELCFSDLEKNEIEATLVQHFASIGAVFAEIALAWYGAPERRENLYRIEGVEHVHEALARGKGVLLYSGHFTAIEICAPAIKALVPLYAFMFRQRRNPLLNALQTRGRRSYAHISVANDDIREMLAMLARNAVVWYAPDQARVDSGELVPFFSQPAMTSTAPSRLARLSGAAIVPLFYRRLADDSGYLLRFEAPLPGIPSGDVIDDTKRLTAVLERFVRECPEQYFWTHRKFKNRPGAADAYSGSTD